MAFLDRLAKAVSDTVEKGKREIDQMAQINRIRGEIRELEQQISALDAQIKAQKTELGDKVLAMLQAGSLSDPELLPYVDRIAGFETEIAGHRGTIAEKEAAIEAIKVEPPAPAAEGAAPEAAGKFCPQCGGALAEGAAFCAQCGAKLT